MAPGSRAIERSKPAVSASVAQADDQFRVDRAFAEAGLTEHLRRRHPRADPLQLLRPYTRSMPFLRQDSSTALTTMPRTNAGIFFIRAAAASSHAIVVGGFRCRTRCRPLAAAPAARRGRDRVTARCARLAATRRTSRACACRAGPRPSDRRSSRRPWRGSRRTGRSSRTPRIVRRARCGGGCR